MWVIPGLLSPPPYSNWIEMFSHECNAFFIKVTFLDVFTLSPKGRYVDVPIPQNTLNLSNFNKCHEQEGDTRWTFHLVVIKASFYAQNINKAFLLSRPNKICQYLSQNCLGNTIVGLTYKTDIDLIFKRIYSTISCLRINIWLIVTLPQNYTKWLQNLNADWVISQLVLSHQMFSCLKPNNKWFTVTFWTTLQIPVFATDCIISLFPWRYL